MKYSQNLSGTDQAELDVTSFLNLMIVLVPVLLLSMTFTQITVLEISLPELTGGEATGENAQSQLEVVIADEGFQVYYPENTLIQEIPKKQVEGEAIYDYVLLSRVLQEVKQQLHEKNDILLLSEADVNYQDLVSTMETVKSYKTTVAASLVEIELFPEISLDNAEKKAGKKG